MQFAKAEDSIAPVRGSGDKAALSLDRLLGAWANTNEATEEIPTLILEKNSQGKLTVHAAGGHLGPADWGKIEADHLFALNIHSQDAAGFTASYQFDSRETRLQANWNQGLLVVASFNTFKEDSGQANYFTREFYRREGSE
ncbi:MAG TPA: hypothetical protein VFB79_23175 [Candidatus Angelobacter sp.]|nr:hypothetical protein [Candidatus Angelobacter sp.]